MSIIRAKPVVTCDIRAYEVVSARCGPWQLVGFFVGRFMSVPLPDRWLLTHLSQGAVRRFFRRCGQTAAGRSGGRILEVLTVVVPIVRCRADLFPASTTRLTACRCGVAARTTRATTARRSVDPSEQRTDTWSRFYYTSCFTGNTFRSPPCAEVAGPRRVRVQTHRRKRHPIHLLQKDLRFAKTAREEIGTLSVRE